MTYKITHKSQTECRIRYIESEPVERSWLNQWHALGIIVIAMIFVPNVSNIYLQLIVYYCLLVIASWLIHFIYRSLLIPALEFEIGLNRIDNRITVTNLLKANKPLQIHPLMNFTGFEYREIPSSHRLENHTPAELYFKFNKDPKIRGTKRKAQSLWRAPIQKIHHVTTVENARTIIAAVNEWLDINEEQV